MWFKLALFIAIGMQVASVVMAFRLHIKYRSHSAWIMLSVAAFLVAVQQIALLWLLWPLSMETPSMRFSLWVACLSAVLVSVLFLGGFTLIEPLFKQLSLLNQTLRGQTEQLKGEKEKLESVVTQTEEELKLAREIQQNLLPKSSPDIAGFDIAGRSIPADWTSGDYFDFIPAPDGRLMIAVADVSGHGTGPALVMVETRALLRVMSSRPISAGEILMAANQMLAEDIQFNRFVTAFLVSIDPISREMTYANAGHDAILIKQSGQVVNLDAQNPPLGIDPDRQICTNDAIQLNSGDLLLLMTDGIAEAKKAGGEEFGVERSIESVRKNLELPASDIVNSLFSAAHDFTNSAKLQDDMTAVVVKIA